MQATTTEPTRKSESLSEVLRRLYARNHDPKEMESFPIFAQEFKKTIEYLKRNPADIKMNIYHAYLLSEVGAAPLVVEKAIGLSPSAEPIDPFLLYSLKIALKRVGEEKIIAQYEPFSAEAVIKHEKPGPTSHKFTPLPKKHWWSKQEYDIKVIPSRDATYGEIKFLAAELGEEYN